MKFQFEFYNYKFITILLVLLFICATKLTSQISSFSSRTHTIILYCIDGKERNDYRLNFNMSSRYLDSIQFIKDEKFITTTVKTWNYRFRLDNTNFYTLVAINPENSQDILGVSDLFRGLEDLKSNFKNLVRREINFDAKSKVILSDKSLLRYINENKLATHTDLFFTNIEVVCLNFPVYEQVIYRSVIGDNSGISKILLSEKSQFLLKPKNEINLTQYNESQGLEFELVLKPNANKLFRNYQYHFTNERLTTQNGNITIKNVDSVLNPTTIALVDGVNPLFGIFKLYEGSKDQSDIFLWERIDKQGLTKKIKFDKNTELTEGFETFIIAQQSGGIPIYHLINFYLFLNNQYTESVFPDLEVSCNLTANKITGEYDHFILTDSAKAVFSVNESIKLPKILHDVILNNPELLKYSLGKELTQHDVYKMLMQKKKKKGFFVISLLVILFIISWLVYKGKTNMIINYLQKPFSFKKPTLPKVPRL